MTPVAMGNPFARYVSYEMPRIFEQIVGAAIHRFARLALQAPTGRTATDSTRGATAPTQNAQEVLAHPALQLGVDFPVPEPCRPSTRTRSRG